MPESSLTESPPKPSFLSDYEQALATARTAVELEVVDQITATSCASALGVVRGAQRDAERRYRAIEKEEKDAARAATMARGGALLDVVRELVEADKVLEEKLVLWRRTMDVVAVSKREHEERMYEEALAQSVNPDFTEANGPPVKTYIPPAPSVYDVPNGRVGLVKRWKFREVDVTKVPDEYTKRVVDRDKVWEAIRKDGVRSIPGLEIYQDDNVSFSENISVGNDKES